MTRRQGLRREHRPHKGVILLRLEDERAFNKIEAARRLIEEFADRLPGQVETIEEARRVVDRFVAYYNAVRLHSAIGYIAPMDFGAGKMEDIWEMRDRNLEAAREMRRQHRLTGAAA